MTTLSYSYSENFQFLGNLLNRWPNYNGTAEISTDTIDIVYKEEKNDLTTLCMQVSEKSLEKVWEKEDDEYWKSYLKD